MILERLQTRSNEVKNMIKDALKYIVGLGEAHEHNIYGETYSDKPLHRIDPYFPKAEAIELHTLDRVSRLHQS